MSAGRILAVDDDRFFREFYADVLAAQDYVIDTVADAEGCLRKLAENSYDLVILDLILENTNGLDLAKRIRADNAGLEIMIATRVDDMVSINRALTLGIKEYVIKPIHEPELVQAVADILERNRIFLEHGKLLAQSAEYFYTLSLYKRGLAILGARELDALIEVMLDSFMQETEASGAVMWLARPESALFSEVGRRGLVDAGELSEFGYSDYRNQDQLLREIPFFPYKEGGAPGELDRTLVHVPFIRNKELLGILKLIRKVGAQFRGKDLRTLRMLGEFSAIAVENARLVLALKERCSRGEYAVLSVERFADIVERERATAIRYSRTFALIEADLPLPVDDVEAFFKDFLRETDAVARLDDKRYRFFLPETDGVGGRSFGRRLVAALRGRGVPRDEIGTIVHASFPGDGEELADLDAVLAERRKAWRSSPAREMRNDDFWSVFDRMLRKAGKASLDKNAFLDIVHYFFADMQSDPRRRTVLFLGLANIGRHSAWLEERLHDVSRQSRITLFGDATDFRLSESLENVVAIHVPAFPGGERYFALYLTGETGLAVLFERGETSARGFLVRDEFLADGLILALQEQYFLQRQL